MKSLLQASERITNVIVVDNGSTDGTRLAAARAGAVVVTADSVGKGQAIAVGIDFVTTDHVLLCDGDLTPFPVSSVDRLTDPSAGDKMIIGYPEFTQNTPWAEPGSLWMFLSGVRSLPTRIVASLVNQGFLRGYAVEVMINRYAMQNGIKAEPFPLLSVYGKVKWGREREQAMRNDFEWLKSIDFDNLNLKEGTTENERTR